jgi:hypothetical protein
MIHTGKIYKFIGNIGLIRPDTFGQSRIDVQFNKNEYNFKLGDSVQYQYVQKKSRRHATNLQKC